MINFYEFEFLSSTQHWSKKHVDKLSPEALSVVLAKTQTAGYGRSGHSWCSPPGNLYLSFVFFTSALPFLHRTTQMIILTTHEWLKTKKVDSAIKWPNDLVVKGKKIGGALTEIIETSKGLAVICGVGLNINESPHDTPSTSLKQETGVVLTDLTSLAHALAEKVSFNLPPFLTQGFLPFKNRFEEALIHKPRDLIRFREKGEVIEGQFLGLDESGALLLEKKEGEIFRSFNGSVE